MKIIGAKVREAQKDMIWPDPERELIDRDFVTGDGHDHITVLPEVRNLTWRHEPPDSLCL